MNKALGLIGTAVTIATPQFRTKLQIPFCNASGGTQWKASIGKQTISSLLTFNSRKLVY